MYSILYSENVPFSLEDNIRNSNGNPNTPAKENETIDETERTSFELEIPTLNIPELPSFDFSSLFSSGRRAPLLPESTLPGVTEILDDDRVFRVPMNLPEDGIRRDPTTQLHQTSRLGIAATFEGIRQGGHVVSTIVEKTEAADSVLQLLPKRPLFRILIGK